MKRGLRPLAGAAGTEKDLLMTLDLSSLGTGLGTGLGRLLAFVTGLITLKRSWAEEVEMEIN